MFGNLKVVLAVALLAALAGCGSDSSSNPAPTTQTLASQWMAGDFHNHTTFTDGSWSMNDLTAPRTIATAAVTDPATLYMQGTAPTAFRNGLGFITNSEHGGYFSTDGFGADASAWTDTSVYATNPAIGDSGKMWRWQVLLSKSDIPGYTGPDYMGAFDWVKTIRANYPDKVMMGGYEMNVPGHEHGSVAIAADTALPIAEFEYRFDANDSDGTLTTATADTMGWTGKKQNSEYTTDIPELGLNALHEKAIDAVQWMEARYQATGEPAYIVPAHIERKGCGGVGNSGYTIAAFRDMNDNAPNVVIGFEGLPGHSKASGRGGFSGSACGGGTYGGAGTYIATVGGLWDNLLADGRKFFTFDSSDFHDPSEDFWPGEYEKNVVKVVDLNDDGAYTQDEVVAGLRSGNVFVTHGDLINELDFKVADASASATMGETLSVATGSQLTVSIRFKSPAANNCEAGANASSGYVCQAPIVHHVQLIQGRVNATKATKFLADGVTPNPDFNAQDATVASIINTFDASSWSTDADGFTTMSFTVANVQNDMFFRIRGSNLGYNVNVTDINGATIYGTDADGNPLLNAGINTADTAWEDLWFYSNPIYVKAN